MEQKLAGKTALVTGAARNIGRATALRLAAAGANVVVNALQDHEAAQAVADEISAAGGQAQVAMADVTDDGLRPLATLTELESLSMHNGHKLTDNGLEHLKKLKRLRELSLFNCENISDAGLVHLQNLGALEKLNLRYTRATDRGVERLREHLPKCEIER